MAAGEGASRAELIEPEPAPALLADPVTARTKPRGRPPGSKNKPKPPVVVTRESEAALRPVVLELAAGCDVAAAVATFARRRGVGVSVLCGRGTVAAVSLRLAAAPAAASAVTLHGRFDLLALSGTVLPSPAEGAGGQFSVSLAGAGGQVIGGTLAGEMMTAADGMVLVAATFGSAEVHRLPTEDDGGREEGAHRRRQPTAVPAGGVGYGAAAGLPADEMVLWAQPTSARCPASTTLTQF